MNTAKLEIVKSSLPLNQRGAELMHHLHLVSNDCSTDLTFDTIQDTDDCVVYSKGSYICRTSTHELRMIIQAGDLNTMEMVTAVTDEGEFHAAVHRDLVKPEFVGVLTDRNSQFVGFVKSIGGVLWGYDNCRLFQIDLQGVENLNTKSTPDAIRYVNKNRSYFEDKPDSIILF